MKLEFFGLGQNLKFQNVLYFGQSLYHRTLNAKIVKKLLFCRRFRRCRELMEPITGRILKLSNFSKVLILKIYFISVIISYNRPLNAQKRENGVILGGYDVIGGPRGLGRENF